MNRVLLTALAAAITLTSGAAAGRAGSAQQEGAVSAWNAIAQAETVLLRPTAHGQMRGMAMVQGAVYDAVNAIDRSRKPYLLDLDEVRVGASRLTRCSRCHGRLPRASGDHAYDPPRRVSLPPIRRRWRRSRTARRSRVVSGPVRRRRRCSPPAMVTVSWHRSRPRSAPTRATGVRSGGRPRRRSTLTAGPEA